MSESCRPVSAPTSDSSIAWKLRKENETLRADHRVEEMANNDLREQLAHAAGENDYWKRRLLEKEVSQSGKLAKSQPISTAQGPCTSPVSVPCTPCVPVPCERVCSPQVRQSFRPSSNEALFRPMLAAEPEMLTEIPQVSATASEENRVGDQASFDYWFGAPIRKQECSEVARPPITESDVQAFKSNGALQDRVALPVQERAPLSMRAAPKDRPQRMCLTTAAASEAPPSLSTVTASQEAVLLSRQATEPNSKEKANFRSAEKPLWERDEVIAPGIMAVPVAGFLLTSLL